MLEDYTCALVLLQMTPYRVNGIITFLLQGKRLEGMSCSLLLRRSSQVFMPCSTLGRRAFEPILSHFLQSKRSNLVSMFKSSHAVRRP